VIVFAVFYCVMAEYYMSITLWQGAAFGLLVWVGAHLVLMPLTGTVPSPFPWVAGGQTWAEHFSEALGHVIWLWSIELVRRDVRNRITHQPAPRRTETAGFTIRESHTLEALAALNEAERDALLLPCDVLVRHLPKIELNDRAVAMLKCGQRPQFTEDMSADQPIRVYDKSGTFIGLVEYQKEIGRLKALRLMNTAQAA